MKIKFLNKNKTSDPNQGTSNNYQTPVLGKDPGPITENNCQL